MLRIIPKNTTRTIDSADEENLIPSSGNIATRSLWKGSSLAKRLNVVGTVTCVLDTAIHLASSRSSVIADFFSDTIPYYVSATYYILPSASLFFMYIKNLCIGGCHEYTQSDDELNEKAQQLVDEFYDVDGFHEYIDSNPRAQVSLLNKIKEMQHNGYIDKIDIFINILYFTLRALQGSLLIVKAYDLASKETNDSITDWTDFISNIINVAYLMTMLIHNNCHKHKVSANRHVLFSNSANTSPTSKSGIIENNISESDTPGLTV